MIRNHTTIPLVLVAEGEIIGTITAAYDTDITDRVTTALSSHFCVTKNYIIFNNPVDITNFGVYAVPFTLLSKREQCEIHVAQTY